MKYPALLLVAAMMLAWHAPAMSLEEPEYQVIESFEDFEIRRYSPYLVAEVDVEGDTNQAGNSAFRILAGYIFGDSRSDEKMKLTAPVASSPADRGEKMAMTAPVASVQSDEGMTTYSFVMERKYSMESLPKPIDERIRIREVPERVMAVHSYSGRWTESNYEKHLKVLQSAVEGAGMAAVGEPVLARYNSPFSLPVLRRNEIMVELTGRDFE